MSLFPDLIDLLRAFDAAGVEYLLVVWLGFPPTRIDLVKWVPGGDFDDAWSRHERRMLGDVAVRLPEDGATPPCLLQLA